MENEQVEKKGKIIVLDDEQNILNSLQRLLRREPYEVMVTSDYQEALKMIEQENVKLVLSDHKMPEISGTDFLKQVKEKNPQIVRILFTGYLDIGVAEEAINKSGVYRFINKPWNEDELKMALRQGINHYDLSQSNIVLNQEVQNQNTELMTMNTKLQNMYEAQKAFSSTVSHELRTPLASIKAAIDIVMSGTTGELTDNQTKFLNKAKSNVDRLNRLINDILDLSKLESGRMAMDYENQSIIRIIEEVADIQRSVAQEKGLELKMELDGETPFIVCDADKINQVLNNLISNAIKFTETGSVTIMSKCFTEENHVEIRVKDTGNGIQEKDIERLFKKFQQLEGPTANQSGGTGLGLAICKEIIGQHKGKIWVESEFLEGSEFCFSLPIKERRENV